MFYLEQQKIRLYYQGIVMKMLRDLEIFKNEKI